MSSSYAQQKRKGGNEPWRNKERHYCAICNAWMGSDRQSILLHENGKKHREAVENDLIKRRDDKKKKEKDKKDLNKVFAQINAAVGAPVSEVASCSAVPRVGTANPWRRAAPPKAETQKQKQKEKVVEPTPTVAKPKQKILDRNLGHYELEGTTYLEGSIYARVLEGGIPVQLWMGSSAATDVEKRDIRNTNHWKMAILAKVTKKNDEECACHVSYLLNATDEDETIESNVLPSRIRLLMGSDPSIPSTIEEAHLALMGGEETIHVSNNHGTEAAPSIDSNTGLSGWSTTVIRKVSSHYEQNQEKKRKRQHEKELNEYKEKKEKEIQARKMEEAKHANAHDSALGAYDVWTSSTSAVEGRPRAYKGVDITNEAKVEAADMARSLSKGMGNVLFKKKKAKKKNIRRTFADD